MNRLQVKKRFLPALGAALLLTACAQQPGPGGGSGVREDPPIQVLGLTAEQKMEDYEYFWATLRDSYPCWGILEREGVDPDAIYQDYKELLQSSDSDGDFYSAIYSALWLLGRNGHLWIEEPDSYEELRAYMAEYQGTDRDRWKELLTSPETAAKYGRLGELARLMEGDAEPAGGAGTEGAEQPPNVTTLLLPGLRTAYLRIDSFAGDEAADKPVLDQFYAQLSGYDDLIIDVTNNSGGSEPYWQQLVAAPLLDAPLECTNYALTRMSANNAPFLENVFEPEELRPIAELPDLPGLDPADKAMATHFVESTLRVDPGADRSPFRGRVWVLVGEWVYSASESFAVFCQQTGFATLVGGPTGGDGIGALDPIYLQLPNSGILVQFTAMFGLNPDGGSNEEHGTAPDILSPHGEPPVITALRAIQQAQ